MKKIAKLMFVAAVAAFTFISCEEKDNPTPKDKENKENNEGENGGTQQQEEVKLAIDGKFDEWKDIAPVTGQDVILLSKTQVDDNKLYFYFEADASAMETDKVAYANYLHLYLECGGDGAGTVSYWGGESGAAYDVLYEIWLMTNGNASVTHWYTGVNGKSKIVDGIYKAEISIDRTANELFSGKILYYGIAITDTYVDTSEGSELWLGGDLSGLSPEQGEEMAKVK
jgi:hypothetical protein